ncbi:MAG: acyl carrier protein [Fimbriimonadaceae bacterium]|jgi:acyl carrier protein
MASSTFDKVKKVVCEELSVPENEVTEGASFTDDLNADSLDVVELVMALEEEFGIDIPDDDVQNLRTVGDAVNYIDSKLKG